MRELDRIIVLVKPIEGCLEWLHQLPTGDESVSSLTIEEAQSDCSVLLFPNFDDSEELAEFIEDIYSDIFETELELWEEDETLWPEKRDFETFLKWFKLEFHSMVYDCDEDLDTLEEE